MNDLAARVNGKIDVAGPTAYIIANDPTKNAALDPDSVISISDNTSIPDKRGVYGTELELDVAGEAGKVLVVTEGTWATDKLLGTQVQQAIDEIGEDGTNTKPLQSVMRAIFRETRGMDAQQVTDHMNQNAPRILRQLDKLSPEEAALPAVQQLRKTLESGLDASTLKAVDAVASEQAAKKAPYEMTPEEYAEQAEQMDEQDLLSEERKQKVRIERAREQWEQQRQEDATEQQKDHAEKLQRRVDEIDEQVGTKTTVVPRAADLPANVAETAIQNGLPPSDVRAVFHNGEVFINAEQSTLATIEATWAHEWTAHRGLRALFGDAFVSEMEKLFDRIGEKVINAALPDYLLGKDKATRVEEYLAQKAERLQEGGTITSQEMGFIDKVVDLIRRFLRKIGIKVAMSDAEMRRLLARANDALQNSVTDIDGNMVPADAEGDVLFKTAPITGASNLNISFDPSSIVSYDGISYIKHDPGFDYSKEALDGIARSVERDLDRLSKIPSSQYNFDFDSVGEKNDVTEPGEHDVRSASGGGDYRGYSNIRGWSGAEESPTVDGDWKRFRKIGFSNQVVKSSEDLAKLFSIYRNPQVEYFHIILTKKTDEGYTILAHNALTSGLPTVTFGVTNDYPFDIIRTM
ncbi:MAG: hypothetical protein WC343_13190, partial [Bacilli bacterium]